MQLKRALSIGQSVVAALAPHCERIEIAGSIRRQRPEVGDLDLVILPQPGKLDSIKARCAQRCARVTDGGQNCIFRMQLQDLTQFQIDLFFARPATRDLLQSVPGNFGTLLLCRTGSKEHNIWLVEHAKRLGLTWNPYRGVIDAEGYVLASESEEEIFKALDLEFVPPEKRER
mgnify:CR=1 FL=1